ncbi:MAG: glycine cleavage system protein GcvH [Verrucomicrobiota bacterium]
MVPDERKYARTHEWVKVDGDTAIVGITDYAQDSLGDITFIELPEIEEYEQESECAVIESVKAASDLYMPVSGKVVGVNEKLAESPELVNEDPFEEGWIFKVQDFNKEELEDLMDASEYEAMLEDEE